ncbi:unnamed protein product [Acanthoscelides obtectus]|uniref:Uncharacterized protein n=1 Tax=Acanthoscelides obtectus TaxID=200917 RepID=A0A9P0P8J4_ACAOB|nr:unnamed protein product [Acanthoscelides obtectus]CAK1666715.1 hypothetical protein AOBTE_LOCUS25448 [Acanthoscelides obtectus]
MECKKNIDTVAEVCDGLNIVLKSMSYMPEGDTIIDKKRPQRVSDDFLPFLQVDANCIAFPPAPQKASIMRSHRHLSAACFATSSGVTEYQLSEIKPHTSSTCSSASSDATELLIELTDEKLSELDVLLLRSMEETVIRVTFVIESTVLTEPLAWEPHLELRNYHEEIINKKIPRVAATRWNYNIRTVYFVYEHREKLIEVFEEIEERCNRGVTLNEASSLRRALEDQEFLFGLTVFHKIFPHVDILYNQLQSRNQDSVQLQKDLVIFEKSTDNIRGQIDDIKKYTETKFESNKRRRTDDSIRGVIAKEVCNIITMQVKDRFFFREWIEPMFMFMGIEKGYEAKEFIDELVTLNNEIEVELRYSITDKIKFVTKNCRTRNGVYKHLVK